MNINPQRVEEIFSAALLKSNPAERAGYLDGACGNDADLRDRVEALLRSNDEAGSFLRPPDGAAPTADPSVTKRHEDAGTIIGHYKLLQRIGEGGFGAVFMAEQQKPLVRKVALKIIKLGMDTKQVIARFEAERQALAMMDHPNIAKVLDAGATETGRPYFVMELVKGIPITEYCDTNKLSTKERLELFMAICRAIQHAHQKGIIHRDIKPSNILVTLHDGVPVPKVIDFGIAKATQHRLTEKTLFTEYRQLVGTPEYMSPEQAEVSGLDVDTRSDLYSLGVLLYELLTGTTPFDAQVLRQAGYEGMQRMIRETEPPKPSTRLSTMGQTLVTVAERRHTDPRKLQQQLKGELDWIVMRCLEKDRTRRYDTAASVAMDVQHYLQGEPVLARPTSASYKLRKFIRRHKVGFAACAAMILLLVLGTVGTTTGMIRARRARDSEEKLKIRALIGEEKAKKEKEVADREAYYARIAAASKHIDSGSVGLALDALLACPEQYRNWEWGHLMFLCHQDILSIELPSKASAKQMAVSEDNQLLAILGQQGDGGVWDISFPGGRQLFCFNPSDRVEVLAFSPDAKGLILGMRDGSVRVCDCRTGTVRFQITEHKACITRLVLSPDGRLLVSASDSDEDRPLLWDLQTRVPRPLPKLFAKGVVRFTPDRRQVGAQDGNQVALVNVDSGQEAPPAQVPPDVEQIELDWLCQHLLTRAKGGKLQLWDFLGHEVLAIETRASIREAFTVPGGCYIGARLLNGSVRLWDVRTKVEAPAPDFSKAELITASLKGNCLAATEMSRVVAAWDPRSTWAGMPGPWFGQPDDQSVVLRGHDADITAIVFSPDSRLIATADGRGFVKVWSTLAGRSILRHPDIVYQPAFSLDGKYLATGCRDRRVRIFDRSSGKLLHSLAGHFQLVRTVAFSPDSKRLVSTGPDRRVIIWDVDTGRRLATLLGHTVAIGAAVFSPDGLQIVTASSDDTVRIWDVANKKELRRFQLRSSCYSVSPKYNRDGTRLAVAGFGKVTIFDLKTSRPPQELEGPSSLVTGLAFSPDGEQLAVAGSEGSIWLWHVATGRPTRQSFTARTSVFQVAFIGDQARLAAVLSEGNSRFGYQSLAILDIQEGRQLLDLRSNLHAGLWLDTNGRTIVTTASDGMARLWESFPWRDGDYGDGPQSKLRERIRAHADAWQTQLGREMAMKAAPDQEEWVPPRDSWPTRPPDAPREAVDLTDHFSGLLTCPWEPFAFATYWDDNLAELPSGQVSVTGTPFDIRGVVPLASNHDDCRNLFPPSVKGIRVSQRARRIHFLHATMALSDCWPPYVRPPEGTAVAAYIMHYTDGTVAQFEIEYGRDTSVWRGPFNTPPLTRSQVAWEGMNGLTRHPAALERVRLYKSTWENPHPDKEIASMDFVSRMTTAAPFLVAVTVDNSDQTTARWQLADLPALIANQNWASETLRMQMCLAAQDLIRHGRAARNDADTFSVDNVRCRLLQWRSGVLAVVADGVPQVAAVRPGDGIYLLETAIPRSSGPPLTGQRWILLNPWELKVYRTQRSPATDQAGWTEQMKQPRVTLGRSSCLLISSNLGIGTRSEYSGTVASSRVQLPAGQYRFGARASDGLRVWVDDVPAIDSWAVGPVREHLSKMIALDDRVHSLRVEYFHDQDKGDETRAELQLWIEPVDKSAALPATRALIGGKQPATQKGDD